MDLWNIKDWNSYHLIHRVQIEPWKTEKTKNGIITLYRSGLGTTYSSRQIRTWEELTKEQKSRAYRDAYEANRKDALWQVTKDPTLEEQYHGWIDQLKRERDEGISAIERGEAVKPPRRVWE